MNFLHIIGGLERSGAELFLSRFCAYGCSSGHVHTVINLGCNTSLSEDMNASIDVFSLNVKKRPFRAVFQLIKLLFKYRGTQYVYGWMYYGNILAFLLGFLLRSKVVFNVRHSLVDIGLESRPVKIAIKINRIFSAFVGKVVYNSVLSRDQHVAFGFSSSPSAVIYNGYFFESERFRVVSQPRVLRLGHAGRYHPMKNQAGIVAAFLQLLEVDSDLEMVFVGRGILDFEKDIESIIPDHFKDRFIFMGELNDLSDFYSSLDLFVNFSSWGESFPNVLVESMSFGVPCVATNLGDVRGIVADYGSVIEPNDSVALLKALAENVASIKSGGSASAARVALMRYVETRFGMPQIYQQFVIHSEAIVTRL